MSAIVTIMDGTAVADSRDVAAAFDRRHDHVLASINDLIRRRPDLAPTFRGKVAKVQTGDGGLRDSPYYLMDRKGFVVLVGGFKGDKALDFRIAFYDAFERMEAIIAQAMADEAAATLPPPPADLIDIREKLLFVREARALGGKVAGRKAWTIAGLPDVFGGVVIPIGGDDRDEGIEAWMEDRLEPSEGRVRAGAMYDDYQRYCAERGIRWRTRAKFGRYIKARGLRAMNSNGIYYRDVTLRATH